MIGQYLSQTNENDTVPKLFGTKQNPSVAVVGRVELEAAASCHPCSRAARSRPPGPRPRAGTGSLVPGVASGSGFSDFAS